MESSWVQSSRAFADAAEWFVGTVAEVGDRWAQPGLGEWDVRGLVGHTSRALLTVETYLGHPADVVDVDSAAGYVVASRAIASGPTVAARGREAGEALGPDPAGAVADIAARVLPLLGTRDGSELVTTIVGGMRLRDYLPTRTFELVVHTADLCRAIGVPPEPPARPARAALELVAHLAAQDGRAAPLLLAATGRLGLPAGYSVL